MTNVGEVILAREVLDIGGSGLAVLMTAGGIGTVAGSLAARFKGAWEWRRAYQIGLGCMAFDLLACAALPSFYLLVPVFVIGGFGNGFALVHDRLLLSHATPDVDARPPVRAAEGLHLGRVRDLLPLRGRDDRLRRRPDRLPRRRHRPARRDRRRLPAPARVLARPGRTRALACLSCVAASLPGRGEIAQLVEHTTENRGVPGSSPGLATSANRRGF